MYELFRITQKSFKLSIIMLFPPSNYLLASTGAKALPGIWAVRMYWFLILIRNKIAIFSDFFISKCEFEFHCLNFNW